MLIAQNKVVTFHYRVSAPEDGLIEGSEGGAPLVYLHGHGGLIKGLEQALEGKQAGDHIHVTLTPDQAYGERIDNAVQRISKNHVLGADKNKVIFKPGMPVQVNTAEGPRMVVVTKVGLKTLDVDTNHPLAGKTLTFDVDIVDVREAGEEEITHGHVHGEGGHHH